MTRQEMEQELKAYGTFVRVYADSDKIVYVPAKIAEKLRQNRKFKEVPEDKMFNSLRHVNVGKNLIAFQY